MHCFELDLCGLAGAARRLSKSNIYISHETIIAEKDRSIKELHCQLTQYLNENDPIKKLADMSIELEKAKEEIEILRVQNQVANEIKDYLNQKWIEQERVVDGVQQLMRKVSAQKRRWNFYPLAEEILSVGSAGLNFLKNQ